MTWVMPSAAAVLKSVLKYKSFKSAAAFKRFKYLNAYQLHRHMFLLLMFAL
jgi:hypothetical protein